MAYTQAWKAVNPYRRHGTHALVGTGTRSGARVAALLGTAWGFPTCSRGDSPTQSGLSCPTLSYPILPYPTLYYPTLPYPILSYPILSYPRRISPKGGHRSLISLVSGQKAGRLARRPCRPAGWSLPSLRFCPTSLSLLPPPSSFPPCLPASLPASLPPSLRASLFPCLPLSLPPLPASLPPSLVARPASRNTII